MVTLAGELIADKKRRRRQFMRSDILLKKARKEPDSSDFMDNIMGAPVSGARMDLDTDNFRFQLTDEGTVAFSAAHQDLADIVAALVTNGESANLSSLTVGTVGDGVWDWDDEVLTSVSGASAEAVNTYLESGTDGTSGLIANHDDWTNLPITPNGGNITIAPAAGGVLSITPT